MSFLIECKLTGEIMDTDILPFYQWMDKFHLVYNKFNNAQKNKVFAGGISHKQDNISYLEDFSIELISAFTKESFAVLSLEGKILSVSPDWLAIQGYQTGEIVKKDFEKYIHEIDRYSVKSCFYDLKNNKQNSCVLKFQFLCGNDEYKQKNTLFFSIKNAEDNVCMIALDLKPDEWQISAEWIEKNFIPLCNIFNATPSCVMIVNKNLQTIYSNTAAVEFLTGLDHDSFNNHSTFLVSLCQINGNPLKLQDNPVNRVFQSKKGIHNEKFALNSQSTEMKYIQLNISPVLNDEEEISLLLCYFIDITKIISSEKNIINNSFRLQHTLESSNDGIWDWNPTDAKFFYNLHFYEILGYEPFEIPQEFDLWADLLHSDEQGLAVKEIKRHIEERNNQFEFDARLRCKSGIYKWVSIQGKVVRRYPDGNPLQLLGSITDITKRKKREAEIQMQADRWYHFFKNWLEPAFICEKSGQIIDANFSAVKKFGYSEEELHQLSFYDICGYLNQDMRDLIHFRLENKNPFIFELEMITRDGRRIPCEAILQAAYPETSKLDIITLKNRNEG